MSENGYHNTRLPFDFRREVLWRALWKYYFSNQIRSSNCVLELGCGYAHFINNVIARRRIALDSWPGFLEHLSPGVEGALIPFQAEPTHAQPPMITTWSSQGSIDSIKRAKFATSVPELVTVHP